jgi:putative transcriptional regulator
MYSLNIKAKRKSQKISQNQLAEMCDVTRETISRIENGKHSPTITLLYKIADALDIPIYELLENNKSA